LGVCFQNIKECGCIELQNRYTLSQLLAVNGSICGNQTSANTGEVSLPEDDLRPFATLYCVFDRNDSFAQNCPCPRPCKERSYDSTSSASGPWPHPVFQQDFYQTFIRYTNFTHKFRAYEDIVSAFENNSLSSVSTKIAEFNSSTALRFMRIFFKADEAFQLTNKKAA
jgi:hypothetical protein